MPQGDGTGPEGKGPKTGRGMGNCPDNDNQCRGQGGQGRRLGRGARRADSRGQGRGAGRGRGRGQDRGDNNVNTQDSKEESE